MRSLRRLSVAMLACGALLSAPACGSSSPTTEPERLTGVEWHLVESSDVSADVASAGIIAVFDGERVTGFSGVNQYNGPYTSESDGAFSAGPLVSTMMAGPEPLMAAEQLYLRLLESAGGFAVDGEMLTITTGDGETLTFEAAELVTLEGSSWVVTAVNNGQEALVGVVEGSQITLEFGADGVVSGNGGVNTFSGSYQVTDLTIEIGEIATTMMAGEPELMEQEAAYVIALRASKSWNVVNGVLTLRDDTDAMQVNAVAP